MTDNKTDTDSDGLGNSFEDEDVWGADDTSDTQEAAQGSTQDSSQDSDPTTETTTTETTTTSATDPDTTSTRESTTNKPQADIEKKTFSKDELPPKITRNGVKEGRDSLTIFLNEDDKKILNRLRFVADNEFDEKIQTLDVYQAAMRGGISGTENEVKRRFIREMEKIGYGF